MNHDRPFPPPSESGSAAGPPYFSRSYELSGKIMLTAIIILFFVVLLMVFLHLYARWYLLRARRRRHHHHHHHNHLRRHRNRRSNLVFYVDPDNNHAVASEPPSCGLDAAVLKTLPVFSFAGDAAEAPECAVCLSEFEENEIGRLLPKCNHSFHIACIDMWFHTHSTCPLCRSAVEAAPGSSGEVNIAVGEPDSNDPAHSHDRCATCQQGEEQSSGSSTSAAETPSSSGGRSKLVEIQIPIRNESFARSEDESPASQNFRSPMSRMLSFTRILSRERRGAVSPSSGCGGGAATTESVV